MAIEHSTQKPRLPEGRYDGSRDADSILHQRPGHARRMVNPQGKPSWRLNIQRKSRACRETAITEAAVRIPSSSAEGQSSGVFTVFGDRRKLRKLRLTLFK